MIITLRLIEITTLSTLKMDTPGYLEDQKLQGTPGFFSELWTAKNGLFSGALTAMGVAFTAIFLGTVLGVFIGITLAYGKQPGRFIARVYTDVIRGIPLLALILANFYLLSVVGVNLNALQAGVLSLGIFCSSHVGEMVRGGLQNLPVGQTEAAQSIGLNFTQTFRYVLLPQALRQILPTWTNTAVEIVKGTTLISVIGLSEIILATQQVIARNFQTLNFYAFAGLIYFIICFSIERLGKHVEKKIAIK